jgi:hypothetical protein
MAREKIELVIDLVADKASSGLRRLKSDLSDADGAFAKTKVASGALWDNLAQHAGAAALGAGAALVGFGVKAVGAFQDIALGAGELRDALGVTAEEASRLQEVAGDLDIPISALESTIGKMNRTAAATPEAFDAIGASIARNADGTTNVQQTFLNTIDALNKIPDATKRAEAAQKIFGRSWQDISQLVGEGADSVKAKLDAVGDAKIVDDKDIDEARELRAGLDDLSDAVSSVSENLGRGLVPALNDVIDLSKKVGGALDFIPPSITRIALAVTNGVPRLLEMAGILDDLTGKEISVSVNPELVTGLRDADVAAEAAADEMDRLATEQAEAQKAAEEHAKALKAEADELYGIADAFTSAADKAIEVREAQEAFNAVVADSEASLDDLVVAARDSARAQTEQAKAAYAAEGATLSQTQAVDINNRKLLDQASMLQGPQRQAILDYIANINGIDEEKISQISAELNNGSVDNADAILRSTSRARTATVTADANTNQAEADLAWVARKRTAIIQALASSIGFGVHARGGTVRPGENLSLVGEEGPELVSLPAGSQVHTASQTAGMLSGGGAAVAVGSSVVVNVTAPLGQNPADFGRTIVAAIKSYEAIAGNAWRNR